MKHELPAVTFSFDTKNFQVTVEKDLDNPVEVYEVAQKINESEYVVTWKDNKTSEPLPAFTIDANNDDYLLWQIIDHIEEYEGSNTYSTIAGELHEGWPENPEELMLKQLPQ